tara:strand:+ start:1319 stop:1516 length:198 start_codon:yes stop_codon:yes gene_type:complete
MTDPAIMPYPQFIYDERQDFKYNFWKWRHMANDEAKAENRPYYTDTEAKAIFQKEYGHYSRGEAL